LTCLLEFSYRRFMYSQLGTSRMTKTRPKNKKAS